MRHPLHRATAVACGAAMPAAWAQAPRHDDDVDETAHDGETPLVYVERVARLKAEHGWRTVEMRRLMPQ